MTSYIHRVLKEWSKQANWPYPSSILVVNDNVPLFDTAQHDYEWMLAVTKDRKCVEIPPCVIRYVSGRNLSLDPKYREEDFNIVMNVLKSENNHAGIKRLHASRAKYFYKMGKYKLARSHFHKSELSIKNIMYIITSYSPVIARWVVKKYNVFG
jgi:hypothetical protein